MSSIADEVRTCGSCAHLVLMSMHSHSEDEVENEVESEGERVGEREDEGKCDGEVELKLWLYSSNLIAPRVQLARLVDAEVRPAAREITETM